MDEQAWTKAHYDPKRDCMILRECDVVRVQEGRIIVRCTKPPEEWTREPSDR